MDKTCETCSRYKAQKVFGRDGICLLVVKNRKFVKRSDSCRFWHQNDTKIGKEVNNGQ